MVRRLEAEAKLTESERERLPADQRVPTKEASEWFKLVEDRIPRFSEDAFARYTSIGRLFQEEEGDQLTRAIHYFRRKVSFLTELQQRIQP